MEKQDFLNSKQNSPEQKEKLSFILPHFQLTDATVLHGWKDWTSGLPLHSDSASTKSDALYCLSTSQKNLGSQKNSWDLRWYISGMEYLKKHQTWGKNCTRMTTVVCYVPKLRFEHTFMCISLYKETQIYFLYSIYL